MATPWLLARAQHLLVVTEYLCVVNGGSDQQNCPQCYSFSVHTSPLPVMRLQTHNFCSRVRAPESSIYCKRTSRMNESCTWWSSSPAHKVLTRWRQQVREPIQPQDEM